MALSTQPYKGTRDFYPDEMRFRRWMFGKLKTVAESYGYEEYDGPMLEPFELYAAKSGEELVNQQLYWMIDRGERKIAVRPEMTPTLARMVAGKINELPKPIRWYTIPNLWRYERPQRGRLREHWQLNVDLLGGDSTLADSEILQVAADLIAAFDPQGNKISIKVNNRRLMDFFFQEKMKLEGALALSVTKAIDARAKIGEEAYTKWMTDLGIGAGQIAELDAFFKEPFEVLKSKMPCPGVTELSNLFEALQGTRAEKVVVFDPTVMRGLDYYTGTVFEVFDTSPENRRAMFGGGRYDNLVGMFGNHKISGVGFGMGDVTLQNFLETHGLVQKPASSIDAFVTLPKMELRAQSDEIARGLREAGIRTMTPLSADGFGAQLKLASKHGAHFAVLLGESELAQNKVMLKDLTQGTQEEIAISALADTLKKRLNRI